MRAINATELAYLRTDNQYSELKLAFIDTPVVFKAKVNQSFTTSDMIYQLTYDNPTGNIADVLPGMTLCVGSDSDNYFDIGQCRIRKSGDTDTLFIGESSEVNWADDLSLTVLQEFGLWAKPMFVQNENTFYMDRDVSYSDQNKYMNPVPVMGPDMVLVYKGVLGGANTISTSDFSDSDSWCLTDTITTHLWECAGATVTNQTTSNPTIQVNAAGTYLVKDTLTTNQGKSTTGYRNLIVFDDNNLPVTQFSLTSAPTGNYEDGGFSFSVEMRDATELSKVRPRAPIILFARDFYGSILSLTGDTYSFVKATNKIQDSASGLAVFKTGMILRVSDSTGNDGIYTVKTGNVAGEIVVSESLKDESAGATITLSELNGQKEISLGQIAGRENIVCTGYIAEEDLEVDYNGGWATFSVKGAHYWLQKIQTFASGVQNTSSSTPTKWTDIHNLTVDKALFQFLYWKSTMCSVMDVYLTGDTKLAENFRVPFSSIWDEIKNIADLSILAPPCCDNYGRLFVEVNGLYNTNLPTFINVQTILASDRQNIEIQYRPLPSISQIDLSGIYYDGSTATAYRSLAPGHTNKRFGEVEQVDKMLLAGQSQANLLSKLVYSQRNNPYPNLTFAMVQNNRFIGICPQQHVNMVISQSDVPRNIDGLATDSYYFFPREVTYDWDEQAHAFQTKLTVEVEYWPQAKDILSATGDFPPTSDTGAIYDFPEFPTIPVPSIPAIPSFTPTPMGYYFLSRVQGDGPVADGQIVFTTTINRGQDCTPLPSTGAATTIKINTAALYLISLWLQDSAAGDGNINVGVNITNGYSYMGHWRGFDLFNQSGGVVIQENSLAFVQFLPVNAILEVDILQAVSPSNWVNARLEITKLST